MITQVAPVLAAVLCLALTGAPADAVASPPTRPAGERTSNAGVFIVQALPGSTVSVSIDGALERRGVSSGDILGPLRLSPGRHTVTVVGRNPDWTMDAKVRTTSRGSIDVVLHRPASVKGPPTVTVYRNPVGAVARGKSRVMVAHTATVPPADITVDGQVVFANIANGEFATAEVPAGPHEASIVPTGRTKPTLLGPIELNAEPRTLTQVFAVGQPANASMDVVVHRLPLRTRGSSAPQRVETGSAGLVAALPAAYWPGRFLLTW